MVSIFVRIAWYDRDNNKYDYGDWKDFKLVDKYIIWSDKQNKLFPRIRYWVEYKEGEDSIIIKNIEEINYVKVDNENDEQVDYLLLG